MSISQQKLWDDEDYRKSQTSKIIKGLTKRPTSFEDKIEIKLKNA